MANSMLNAAAKQNFHRLILITGEPGVGKTTLTKRLAERLRREGETRSVSGFYTEELRDDGNYRIGFDIIDIVEPSRRAPLARTNVSDLTAPSDAKVGKYTVDVSSFESFGVPLIQPSQQDKHIYVVDEIGKMELFSRKFQRSVETLLAKLAKNDSRFLVLATVPIKSLKFTDNLKAHPSAKLFTVTHQNRNSMVDQVYEFILNSYKNL